MKPLCLVLIVSAALLAQAQGQKAERSPFAGRWDLTITTPKDTYPSWMEFQEKGGVPAVRIVGRVASAHPAKDIKVEGSHLTFVTSEWFDGEKNVTWEFTAGNGKLTGVQK